jgi:copper resistance protein D
MSLHYLTVSLHLLAALLWLGGMFFLAVVGAPVLRRVEPAALRAQLFEALGRQFRTVGWVALAVLVVTGVANLHFRGLLRMDLWLNAAFWSSSYGQALAWKLTAVLIMITISAVHDFVLGPAAGRQTAGTREALRLRRRAAWLARGNALVGVVLVLAAVRLARGV